MYLNCKTYYSFRYGTFSTEELVKQGYEMGATALAITNINNTCDVWDFVKHCKNYMIKPILGTEIRNGDELLYILLAANNRGLQWINQFLSKHLKTKEDFPATTGTETFFYDAWDGFVVYPVGKKKLSELLSNELIGIRPHEVNKLFGQQIEYHTGKFVILSSVSFQDKIYYGVHRLLRSIDKNILLSQLGPEATALPSEHFISPTELINRFKQYSFIITNTYKIMDACSISMDFGTDKNKRTFSATKRDDMQLLRKLAYDGLQTRYGDNNDQARKRVDKELEIIDKLGFNSYFLITWDIVSYARNRGFYHVGRGSGANSIVAYCLQITEVDPIELDLYFERFLNPYRTSPPDFDIDFSWLDRDEVIDYVFKRYGEDHVALLGMYSTFKERAVIRELGKVFGLPKTEIDTLSDNGYSKLNGKNGDAIQRLIFQYGRLMQGFPNHASIHPGGMLISEESIYAYTATWLPPKDFNTSQLDMFMAEDIGLYKLDILSQRGLGHIKEAIRLIKENKQVEINIDDTDTFKNDPRVRNQIRMADTIGCFYVESPAMRQLLKKLECDDYLTLVAASSIIRPGVAQSGMMREYIYRYHNPGKFEYLHPKMEELLKETFGVMVFQEDVIKVAHHFAGLDEGESDVLRRAMSGKYRGNQEMMRIRAKFFINCKEKAYPDELSAEVWRQIESFGGYSFSKAHSASFAVESFQDLYLKVYFPLEFMVGVINNFGGFYPTSLYFYQLLKAGAKLHLPCVNLSKYITDIKGIDVYMGFTHIKELEKKLAERIIEERKKYGSYLNLQDFIERTGITLEQLNVLVNIGAFRFTGKNKKQLLWEANFLQKKNKEHIPASAGLFEEKPVEFKLPQLAVDPLDDMYDEMEILGFPFRNPFELVDDNPSNYSFAKEINQYKGENITLLAYFIADKVVPTKKNTTMSFGTFIDAKLDWLDTVHFPEAFERYPLQGRGFYKIKGKVIEEFGFYSVEVTDLIKVGYKERKYANM